MEKESEQHQRCNCCNELTQLKEKTKTEKQTRLIKQKTLQMMNIEIQDFFEELKESSITKDKLLEVLKKTFEETLKVRSKPFFRNGKKILDLLEIIIDKPIQSQSNKQEISTQPSLSSSLKKEEQPVPQYQEHQERKQQDEDLDINDFTNLTNSLANVSISQISSNSLDPSFTQQNFNFIPQNIQNPIILEIPPPAISLPIQWERHPNFEISGKTIRSKFNGWYKLCSLDSLPKSGKYSFKFKVKTLGTVSFGVAIEQKKNSRFIEDRDFGCINYVSFANGSGMIKKDGEVITSNQNVHISCGTNIEITLNFNTNDIIFKNSRADHERISMSPKYANLNLYLFLHTKDSGTLIEQL